jgi:hypothetical protein
MKSISELASISWPQQVVQCFATASHFSQCGSIALLLGIGTWTVYATGGTAFAYPYIMLIPVLIAASWYCLAGRTDHGPRRGYPDGVHAARRDPWKPAVNGHQK